MKKLSVLLLLAASCLFTGCLDMLEEINLAPNGSGTYKTTMDMSGMFEMIEMMAAMDTSAKGGLKGLTGKSVDTSFALKGIADTSSKLTADQKRLLSRATVRMRMNEAEKKMIFNLDFPFDKIEDVGQLAKMNEGGKSLGMLNGNAGALLGDEGEEAGMPTPNFLETNFKPGLLERKLNQQLFEAFSAKLKMKGGAEMESMLEAMKMKSVIRLPAPAKSVAGEKAVLSEDRKTVTIQYNFADLLNKPSALTYRIEY
jgi:hypothetical protein